MSDSESHQWAQRHVMATVLTARCLPVPVRKTVRVFAVYPSSEPVGRAHFILVCNKQSMHNRF